MNNYVEIILRRNRGWPWPEDTWGLTPMYGEDGWCQSCGVPKHPQTGSIILQRKGLKIEGAWVPNWQFDVYCLAQSIADVVSERFGIGLRPVASVSEPAIGASQVVIESSVASWFDSADLNRLIAPIHGDASETCADCGVTRWMPVGMDVLPGPPESIVAAQPGVVASPEWFGAGKQSFRQILWRRDVADFLVSSSPKDFKVQEVG
ncbi:hypothetical protein [Nocardioides psychrotolerans]|uniref:hypothetical protein n=1 Tax=Nocardioides psychrotolerans TaxID=1005945 RepID=UPI00313819B4